MADRQLHSLVHLLRKTIARQVAGGLDDVQFAGAFRRPPRRGSFRAAAIGRHGSMVLRVCTRCACATPRKRKTLSRQPFLVLARKAATIGKGDSLAGWLYRVAFRIALRARTRSVRGPLRPTTRRRVCSRVTGRRQLAGSGLCSGRGGQSAAGEIPRALCPLLPGRAHQRGGRSPARLSAWDGPVPSGTRPSAAPEHGLRVAALPWRRAD